MVVKKEEKKVVTSPTKEKKEVASTIQERKEAFEAFLKSLDGNTFDILLTHIDPDSLGSAFGMQAAIWSVLGEDVTVRIFSCGIFANAQNRIIANFYDLDRKIHSVDEYIEEKEKGHLVLVDSSKLTDSRIPINEEIQPVIIVDHHRDGELTEHEDQFCWIEDMGSASTMVFELATECGVDFKEEKYGWVATLLAIGIKTDTKSLNNGTKRDVFAYGNLKEFINSQDFDKLVRFTLPPSYFENLENALRTLSQNGPRVVSGLGVISDEEADDVATISDYLLRLDGASLVIVWAFNKGTNQVRIAARCSDPTTNLSSFQKKRFGQDSSGSKFVPGGQGEGGALFDMDFGPLMTNSPDVNAQVEKMIHTAITELVFAD